MPSPQLRTLLTGLPEGKATQPLVSAEGIALLMVCAREEKNLAPADYKRISGYRREFDKKLTALLDDGVRAGEFVCADTRIASLAIGGLVSWTYVWYRPHGRLKLDEVAAEISTLILAMLNARPPETISAGAANC